MKIQSLEFLKNRYFNLLTYIDTYQANDEVKELLKRISSLLNIPEAVEEVLETQSTEILLDEKTKTISKYCKKISFDNYSKYAFSYVKKSYFPSIIDRANKDIENAEAELEKIKGEKNPILREKLEQNLKNAKVYKSAVIKARNSKDINEIQEPFRTNLLSEIQIDYDKNEGILPEYIKDYAILDLTQKAYATAFDFYPTPKSAIDTMLEYAQIKNYQKVLEPSAGKGDILDALANYNNTLDLDYCEFNTYNSEILDLKCYNNVGRDFLEVIPNPIYDRILMNPPFADRSDITHIRHAFQFLKDDGILIAIITNKSLSNSTPLTAQMRKDAENWGEIIELEDDIMTTDAERKAQVKINIIVLHKIKYLEELAQRESAVDLEEIKVGDYFFDNHSELVWQVAEYANLKIKLINKISLGVSKTYDLSQVPLRSSLRPISEEKALAIIKEKRDKIEEIQKNIDTQCDNIDFESFCATGEYVPLTNLLTARPQFAQKATIDVIDSLNLNIASGFKLSPTVNEGVNLAIESINKSGAFLLTDGTGAGKTIQQLLVAKYYVDKYQKPFLICTKDDRIIDQSFMGDAAKIGMLEYIQKLPPLNDPKKVPSLLENGKIYICKYYDFSFDDKGIADLEAWNKAKSDWRKQTAYYNGLIKDLNKAYPTKEDKKLKGYKDAIADIRTSKRNDPIRVDLFNAETQWAEWNKNVFNEIGINLSGIAFDECHELKNWDDYDFQNGMRAKRAMWVSEVCSRRLFVSATPCDRADAMLYLYQANVTPTKEQFERLLYLIGFVRNDEERNDVGMVVRRARWTVGKQDFLQASLQVQNIYEDMTEDGRMIKREIPLTNYNVAIKSIKVPQTALDTIMDIQKFYAQNAEDRKAEKENEDKDENVGSTKKLSKATMYGEMIRSLEPYKIASAIEIVENEIKNCRSVVIFAGLRDEGAVAKEWGEVKAGTIETLYNYFVSIYGADRVGKVVGAAGEKERKQVLQDVAEFQQNKKWIMLATTGAGGTGISLDDQTGERPRSLICLTAPINAEGNVQMLGRIYRLQTKTCANAFYLFADGVAIEKWLATLVSNKMLLLNATVGGEVDKLNIGNLKSGDVDDSLDALIAETSGGIDKKETEARITSHPIFNLYQTNDWIDGKDYPDKVNIKIRYIEQGRDNFVQIKSNTKENLLNWALPYKEKLNEFGFNLTSDRYEGAMYSLSFDGSSINNTAKDRFRSVWGFLINIILPQRANYISGEDNNIYNVGDMLQLTQANAMGGQIGDEVEIVSFRKRPVSKVKVNDNEYKEAYEYLYDAMIKTGEAAGTLIKRLKSYELKFVNKNEIYDRLDFKETVIINVDSLIDEFNNIKIKDYQGVLTFVERGFFRIEYKLIDSANSNRFCGNVSIFNENGGQLKPYQFSTDNRNEMMFLSLFLDMINKRFNKKFDLLSIYETEWTKKSLIAEWGNAQYHKDIMLNYEQYYQANQVTGVGKLENKNVRNNKVSNNNLADNIVVDTNKNNNIKLNDIDSEFNLTEDNDFILVNSKDNEIIAKINKINALITKNTKYFQNLSFSKSNELLSNIINLRNLLLDKKLIVINNNLTNNLADNIDVRKSIFDTANDLYEQLKNGQFDPTDVLSNIIPILK